MNNRIQTYGALVLSMIFWSFSFIWFKIANQTFTPLTIIFIRLVFAVIILTTYLYATKKFVKIKKEDRRLFLLLALFEPFFYFLGESNGLTYVSATAGSVIISTIPVVATLGSWILFRERLRFINYAGIILSFAGVLIYILRADGSVSYNPKGIALLTLAVMSAVGYNLTLSKLVGNYSPVYIVNVQNVIGAILFLPLFVWFDFKDFMNLPFTFSMFKPILELSFFASCFAFILYAFSARNLGITRTNVFSNSIPVFTAILSWILLGENISLRNIIGMAVVIAGLFLSQINMEKNEEDEPIAISGRTA